MVMGDKIYNLPNTLFFTGAIVSKHLKDADLRIDELYLKVKKEKDISFKKLIYTLDFLFIINKIELKKKDIIGFKR